MTSPFDQLKTVTQTKEYDYDETAYVPFVINKALSYSIETVLYANMMNRHHNIDKQAQYDYYFYSLPKRRHYSKWYKKEKDEALEIVMEYYQYNIPKAKQALRILTKEQIDEIKKNFEKGGIKSE